MLQHEQYTFRVVDAGVTGVGEENRSELRAVCERNDIFRLTDFVTPDVLDGVEELGGAVRADRAVAHGKDIIAPSSAGYDRG